MSQAFKIFKMNSKKPLHFFKQIQVFMNFKIISVWIKKLASLSQSGKMKV